MPSNFSIQLIASNVSALEALTERYAVPKSAAVNRLLEQYLAGNIACPGLPKVAPGELIKPDRKRRGTGDAP